MRRCDDVFLEPGAVALRGDTAFVKWTMGSMDAYDPGGLRWTGISGQSPSLTSEAGHRP